jgi:DNA processing protein
MQESTLVLLHLSLIDGVGPGTIQVIRDHKPADMPWAELYQLSIADLRHHFDLGSVVTQNLFYGLADDGLLKQELALLADDKFSLITILDSSYPALLKNINAPPAVLYIQGADLATFTKCLAVIGSRDADRYGKQVIESLVPPLVEHGWSIVSGGALGADAMAHAATLKAGGKTIAIIGSGLLHPSPTSNLNLFDTILANDGALVSIFPLNMKSRPENFPIRNRIISGLSRGVIVAQAARKSGTRITAQYALEQGRDVFAIPGLIDNPLSEGCHALIQEGAKLISRADDVFEEYGEVMKKDEVPQSTRDERNEIQLGILSVESLESEPRSRVQATRKRVELKTEIQSLSVRPGASTSSAERQSLDNLASKQACHESIEGIEGLEGHALITALCKKPASIDDLFWHINIPLPELQTLLFNMQLDGMIQQNFAGLWECQ